MSVITLDVFLTGVQVPPELRTRARQKAVKAKEQQEIRKRRYVAAVLRAALAGRMSPAKANAMLDGLRLK